MSEETDKRVVMLPGCPVVGAVQLLQQLTKRFPPIARHAHSLTLYQGKLQVNLVNTTPCWKFTLDADDLTKPAEQLVMEIARLMPKDPPKTAA
jgi:hypothetical protein